MSEPLPPCEHVNGYTSAIFGRHNLVEGGPVLAFTVAFRLECVDCKTPFYFGFYPRLKDHRTTLEVSCAPWPAPLEAPWVPGEFECPMCMYRESSMTLDAKSGAVGANRDAKPAVCPNDGEQLKRVTWQQSSNDLGLAAIRYARRVRQLEAAWPAGYSMPVEEDDE